MKRAFVSCRADRTPPTSMLGKKDASVAVEFAFIAPILLTMLGGLVDFSFIYYSFNTAQQAGWRIARQVATGQLPASSAASTVRLQLPTWVQAKATIPAVVQSNGIYTVSVTIALSDATPIKFLRSIYGSATLTTTASFVAEAS